MPDEEAVTTTKAMTKEELFNDLTIRAMSGERIGYWCFDHREAVALFRDYFDWLRMHKVSGCTVRKSTCEVSFCGGCVRFISTASQADGIRKYGDGWTW